MPTSSERMTFKRSLILAIACFTVTGWAATDGKTLVEQGQRAFQKGDFSKAVSDWQRAAELCRQEARRSYFFDAKSVFEALVSVSGRREAFTFGRGDHQALHPGQSAAIELAGRTVGWLGRRSATGSRSRTSTSRVTNVLI